MGAPYLHDPLSKKEIQELLCYHRFGVVIDGAPGKATKRAMSEFMEAAGVPNWQWAYPLPKAAQDLLVEPFRRLTHLASDTSIGVYATFADALVGFAEDFLDADFHEIGGDNKGPCVRMVSDGSEGGPWCANYDTFIVGLAHDYMTRSGKPPRFDKARYRSGYCPTLERVAREDGRLITKEAALLNPLLVKKGMLFLVWGRDAAGNLRSFHTGIVRDDAWPDGTYSTIEGNTNDDGSREGFEVARRVRAVDNCNFVDLLK